MKFEDKGFLLNKNKFNENSSIVEFFTENKGKISGIIYGATSSKIKNFLFIGNHFTVQFNSKTQNSVGYFKVEIDKVFTPFFLDDKIKLNCILYSINLIKILTVEDQSNIKIYNHLFKLYELLETDDWIKKFIFWELELIKFVGYDINFKDYIDVNKIKSKSLYIPTLDGSKEIPIFLIENNKDKVNRDELKVGFKIVGDFLNKSILIPNNINYPVLRTEFYKLI
tara:strand:+ start:638 stop:1312 length:675 start_codon:yes stop_codon:yes gene_type:complete